MDERTREALDRTLCALSRHLEDLMDEVEQDDGRIRSPRTLEGIHMALESMSWATSLSGEKSAEATGKANASREKAAL